MYTVYIEREYNYMFLECTFKRIFFCILKFIFQNYKTNEKEHKETIMNIWQIWIILNYEIKED